MKFLWTDRRVFVSIFAICCLTAIALVNNMDTSMSVAAVAAAIAAANATQKSLEKKYKGDSNA